MKSNSGITIPINITLGLGAYTAEIRVGSEQLPVQVILDSGSSTLAIKTDKYQPETDQALTSTTYVQGLVYGAGGWFGPVVNTAIQFGNKHSIQLPQAPLALIEDAAATAFQQADGIWGLAYHHLNKAYDTSDFLHQQKPAKSATYPWPFDATNAPTEAKAFKKFLRQFPEHDITPLFTELANEQVTANQFAIITHRSIEYVPKLDMTTQALEQEPLNQGQFVIGYPLPTNPQRSIQVLHDDYYNVNLVSCRVAGFDACPAPPLDEKHRDSFFSNAIIDTGCSFLVLQQKLYDHVISSLQQCHPAYKPIIDDFTQASQQGKAYKNPDLNLDQWPDLFLSFSGADQEVELKLTPDSYWQQHAREPDNWYFMLMPQLPHWPDQTLCGLPLINNYVCVFDRADPERGMIHWLDKA